MKGFLIKIMPGFFVRLVAAPYVAGKGMDKGISKAQELWTKKRIKSTIDLLGEAVYSREEVEEIRDVYLELLDKLGALGAGEYAGISIKPTSLGVHESEEYCISNIEMILERAAKYNIVVTLDMEDHEFTDVTLSMYKKLQPKYPMFRTVLQSRLFRTEEDVQGLLGMNGGIRACIGIYKEPPEIAHTDKREMKEKLLEIADTLLADGFLVGFATHDKEYIQKAKELFESKGYPKEKIEFQQLLGVPMEGMQEWLVEEGYAVRLYVPFAIEWKYGIAYLKRRLNNNPKMAYYVIKNMFRSVFGIFLPKKNYS